MSSLSPVVSGVSVQIPAATVATQFTVPSVTVTSPAGVPPAEVTANLTSIPWATTDGSGWSLVIVVAVAAALSVIVLEVAG